MSTDPGGNLPQPSQHPPGASAVSDDDALKDQLLGLLPVDGTSKSNGTLMDELKSGKDAFWRVRDLLVEDGLAQRGRGRGGSTSRLLVEKPSPIGPGGGAGTTPQTPRITEESLYDPIKEVLLGDWQSDKGFEYLAVEDIARAGSRPTGGKWTRPDLVAVEVQVFTYLPTKALEVHTFEVKPSDAIDVTAVYEALSHRRAATHSYVLLHVPAETESLGLDAIVAEAREHGIGVVVFSDPGDYQTWEERAVAKRVDPVPAALNEFIKVQLPEGVCSKIERAVR